ncbi:hypothetical protein ACFLZO_00840 [Patescibacteria group bacterium]
MKRERAEFTVAFMTSGVVMQMMAFWTEPSFSTLVILLRITLIAFFRMLFHKFITSKR